MLARRLCSSTPDLLIIVFNDHDWLERHVIGQEIVEGEEGTCNYGIVGPCFVKGPTLKRRGKTKIVI